MCSRDPVQEFCGEVYEEETVRMKGFESIMVYCKLLCICEGCNEFQGNI